ncbi:MAG: pentapeptide repeat-containing protein, partial [Rhizobiales bacterium]|nr:pentapeptide repeat-containing protein [Hyphomicrobiales bacterium]
KFYEANLANAVFEGTRIRFAIFQDAFMEGCKGCPFDWQRGEKDWEEDKARWEPAPQ